MCQMYMLVDTCNMNYLEASEKNRKSGFESSSLSWGKLFILSNKTSDSAEELSRDSIKICNVLQSHSFNVPILIAF